jgi:hypothetical protein
MQFKNFEFNLIYFLLNSNSIQFNSIQVACIVIQYFHSNEIKFHKLNLFFHHF